VTVRRIAPLLPLAAAALYLGVVQPRQREVAVAQAALARAEAKHAEVRDRLARATRSRDRSAAFAAQWRQATDLTSAPTALRRRILAALAGQPVTDLRLELGSIDRTDARKVRVEARGRFLDLVRLTTVLARPELGLALVQVTLAPPSGPAPGIGLVVEARTLGGTS
jgi:hypothetical protein